MLAISFSRSIPRCVTEAWGYPHQRKVRHISWLGELVNYYSSIFFKIQLHDEEADLLYWLPESRSHEQEKSEPSSSTNLKHAPGDQVEDADASNVVGGADTELVSGGGEEIKVIVSQDDDFADSKSDSETSSALDKLDINESTDVKMGEDQKNLNKNDDKMETGSVGIGSVGSKSSSCITPSDERSNDENVSSLKESDNASSESGSLNEWVMVYPHLRN